MKSPLLIGTDLSKLSGTYIDILKNKDLLAFNQDPNVGAPAEPFLWDYTSLPEFWAGSYGDGRELVLMVNYGDGDATKEVQWGDVPGTNAGKCYLVEDIWTGDMVGCMNGGLKVDVASHDTAGFVVSGEC